MPPIKISYRTAMESRIPEWRKSPVHIWFFGTEVSDGLRVILARYFEITPDRLRFFRGAQGKPKLRNRTLGGSPLHFNLSHSGGLSVLAVSMKFQVGVDLEKVGKPRPFLKLSERFFSPLECKWIAQGVGSPAQELRFLKTWTAKEAVIKAKGGGVFKDLSRIRVKAGRAGSIQILSHPFSHYALKCPRGYVGALCLK